MNKLTVAALALAAIGLASTAASAQVVTSTGDLILGFQLAGVPTDLEVDLGSQSLFTQNATLNLSSKFSVNDLSSSSTFGSTWASNSAGVGVQWSVSGQVGGSGATKNDLDLTSLVPVASVGTNALGGTFKVIGNLDSGLNNSPVASTGTSSLIGTTSQPANSSAFPNSYSNLEPSLANLTANVEQTGAGTDELYQYVGAGNTGTTIDLGTFKLTSTGGLTFTGSAAAVPEPSAYALGICAALLFLVLRRRASVA